MALPPEGSSKYGKISASRHRSADKGAKEMWVQLDAPEKNICKKKIPAGKFIENGVIYFSQRGNFLAVSLET